MLLKLEVHASLAWPSAFLSFSLHLHSHDMRLGLFTTALAGAEQQGAAGADSAGHFCSRVLVPLLCMCHAAVAYASEVRAGAELADRGIFVACTSLWISLAGLWDPR